MPDVNMDMISFIHGLTRAHIPDAVMHMGRRCLVDLVAIWASGVATKPSQVARDHAARRYGAAEGAITMPFDGRKVSGPSYAFAGGATIDAIDGHDGHQSCKGHAGAALLPALLAELGDAPECSMDEFLTHLIIGYEVAIRTGLSLHATACDYHSSGAWNALGCAAMAARIRGLGEEQTRHALGIAEYFGPRGPMMRCIDHPTMVKDGTSWGAMTGVSAADLAEDGFTGAPAVTIEGADVAHFWSDLGQNWRILESNFKAYPVCRWAQPPVEAVLALQREHNINPGEITEIIVSTFHEATRLSTRRPLDCDGAQFSLPLAVSLALNHGTILPEHTLPENFDCPEVWHFVDMVRFAERDDYNAAFPGERFADVTLEMSDGRRLSSEPSVARGNHDAPLLDTEILAKLAHYAIPVLDQATRDQISLVLTDPDHAPTPAELITLICPKTTNT